MLSKQTPGQKAEAGFETEHVKTKAVVLKHIFYFNSIVNVPIIQQLFLGMKLKIKIVIYAKMCFFLAEKSNLS